MAQRKAREKKKMLNEAATAIAGSIRRKGEDGVIHFIPIGRLAAFIDHAITLDPSVMSTNLVEQATESAAGAGRLLKALDEIVDQHESFDLGDFQISEDPMTAEQMTEAVASTMAAAFGPAFAATDGSKRPTDLANEYLISTGLTEAVLACPEEMPDPLATKREVVAFLRALTEHLERDALEEGWMGLVINEDEKIVMKMDRDQIDMQAVQIAAKSTWVNTPNTIQLKSFLRPDGRDSSESVDSFASRGGSEESNVDGEELETLRSKCDQLEKQVETLEEQAEAQRVLIADWDRKLATISEQVEKMNRRNDRSASEIERLNDRVSGLQANTTATPHPSLPPCLRSFSPAQLENYATQIRGADPSVLLKMYKDLGEATCAALIGYTTDESQDRTDPPRRRVTPPSQPPQRRLGGASPRGDAFALGGAFALDEIVTFSMNRSTRNSRMAAMTPKALISRVTGLSFDTKTGKILGPDGHVMQRADINEASVEAALLNAAPVIATHLIGSELGSITKNLTLSGSKTLSFNDEGEALLVETIREIMKNPHLVWMLRHDMEDRMGGSEQYLEMLLGADSREAHEALKFVTDAQALFLGSLDVVKECYQKCVTEQGSDKGEGLFQRILGMVIDTITMHTGTISGALTKAYATQHLLGCILNIGCEDTYYVNAEHPAMHVRAKDEPKNQKSKFKGLMLRVNADLPYTSGSDEEYEWPTRDQEDWRKEAETNATIDPKQLALYEKDITYLNGMLSSGKSKGPTLAQGSGVPCLFCSQPASFKGGHKSEDCANLAAFATTNGITGKAKLYAAACEKMRKLNKVLVKELVREKFFVKKLAPVLPGGSHFRP